MKNSLLGNFRKATSGSDSLNRCDHALNLARKLFPERLGFSFVLCCCVVHYYTYESKGEHALCKLKPTALVNDENLHIAHQKKGVII